MLDERGDDSEVTTNGTIVEMLTEEPTDLEIMLHALLGWAALKTMQIIEKISAHG